MADKTNVLFVLPLFYDPTLPNFKDRFEVLSEKCTGHIISISDKKYEGVNFGDFTYHAMPAIRNRALKYAFQICFIVAFALRYNRGRKFDYVCSADPLFMGLASAIVSVLTGAKLIVEFNGDYGGAPVAAKKCFSQRMKSIVFLRLARISLLKAFGVKFLNTGQMESWSACLNGKKTAVFHDFVPTHVFNASDSADGKYILFAGHPFYLKGVDILIQAFVSISDRFPEMKLRIIGHCHEEEKAQFLKLAGGNKKVEILPPVFYGEIIKQFQGCTIFVLPSRSEAMGRVLVEAMACGKAVIGSDTGGIPEVIEDGRNGLLFKSGNVCDLAARMEELLLDERLRGKMGRAGLETVRKKFSSSKYAESYFGLLL